MKRILHYVSALILIIAAVSCTSEPISLGEINTGSSYKAGESFAVAVATTSGVPVTAEVKYTDPDGVTSDVSVSGDQIILKRGTYEITYKAQNGLAIVSSFKAEEMPLDGIFAGFGTKNRPYELSSADDFDKLNLNRSAILERDGYSFCLTDDIDLRSIEDRNYAAPVFGGTLEGNGHKIIGSNSLSFIFDHYLEDTEFRNLTIEFDSASITRLFRSPLVRVKNAIAKGNEYTSEGDDLGGSSDRFLTDKRTLSLTIDNVNYAAPGNHYYSIGDNNFSFYASNNVSGVDVYLNGETIPSYTTCLFYDESVNKSIEYSISISGCDVSGNFIGGFGDSGAAVFLGGQLYGAKAEINNCTFSGDLVGYKVGLLAANVSASRYNRISADSVVNNGTIKASSGSSSLSYGNSKSENIDGISGSPVASFDSKLSLAMPAANGEFVLPSDGIYQLKLFLPSVYWFKKGSSDCIAQTNSNTLTINVSSEEKAYKAKAISDTDAEKSGIPELSDIGWNTVTTVSAEGYKYRFVDVSGTVYLVICYGSDKVDYSYSKTADSDLSGRSYLTNALLISYNDDGSIKDMSQRV